VAQLRPLRAEPSPALAFVDVEDKVRAIAVVGEGVEVDELEGDFAGRFWG
jgi:hypothetical protein